MSKHGSMASWKEAMNIEDTVDGYDPPDLPGPVDVAECEGCGERVPAEDLATVQSSSGETTQCSWCRTPR